MVVFTLDCFGMRTLPPSLLPRTFSTVGLWTAVIATFLLRSEVLFAALIIVPALGSLWEYFALLKSGGISHHRGFGMGTALVLIGLNFWLLPSREITPWMIYPTEIAVLALFVPLLFLREFGRNNPGRDTAEAIAFTLLGVIYIPWLFLFLAKLFYLTPRTWDGHPTGQYLVLFVVAVTKFTDVGAFLSGSLFGRTPFFPNISPKKTWEGILGGILLGVLTGAAITWFLGGRITVFHFTLPVACLLSLILAVAGVAGDLAESLLKRSVHTKDSGHALPGIGGGLDLIDSLLFTAPLFYFLLQFFPHLR